MSSCLKYLAVLILLTLVSTPSRSQQPVSFPYPSVPDSLRTSDSRAEYVLSHYWDNYDFSDTTLYHRPEVTEQGFVNFIDLLPRVKPATAAMGLTTFADRLYSYSKAGNGASPAVDYFSDLTDRYLGDEASPLHNDMLYAQFLDAMASNKFANAATRSRNAYMASNLRKNLPGSVAADFTYIDRHSDRHTLRAFKADYTLLFFYDPDCNHCHDMERELAAMPELCSDSSRVRVLAVYPYSDTGVWLAAEGTFPSAWTDGYSPDGIITTDDIYYIKSMPSIYLLDAGKHVLLKNPDIKVLKECLNKIF